MQNGGAIHDTVLTPFTVKVSASGCSTLNYSQPIDATTSATQQLSGCQ